MMLVITASADIGQLQIIDYAPHIDRDIEKAPVRRPCTGQDLSVPARGPPAEHGTDRAAIEATAVHSECHQPLAEDALVLGVGTGSEKIANFCDLTHLRTLFQQSF